MHYRLEHLFDNFKVFIYIYMCVCVCVCVCVCARGIAFSYNASPREDNIYHEYFGHGSSTNFKINF